jgi:hypothetical protein
MGMQVRLRKRTSNVNDNDFRFNGLIEQYASHAVTTINSHPEEQRLPSTCLAREAKCEIKAQIL